MPAATKRHWRFDFMGASRYFFSMSGVILLVGALAIGGRGLKLGIDFTGGTQISVGLQQKATVNAGQVAGPKRRRQRRHGAGGPQEQDARQLRLPDHIEVPVAAEVREAARPCFETRYGILGGTKGFNTTSVGPAFGSTITHSALVAIIVSLIVISLYVALRFEWKFTVPVLIALMHDLLITAGVYALTGRTVTADTVAALLTILGYSLYDTIIVFDRVRENVPRMPRAAFSQVVNRSMSEVLTRSLITTSCTLLPVIALLLFGGSTLKDFAFALLVGVASGAYSSIFIASPVLTHWKEREHGYRARRERITADLGYVPAYADGGDVDPTPAPRPLDRSPDGAAGGERLGGRVRADEARPRPRGGRAAAGARHGSSSAPRTRPRTTTDLLRRRPVRRAPAVPRSPRHRPPTLGCPSRCHLSKPMTMLTRATKLPSATMPTPR